MNRLAAPHHLAPLDLSVEIERKLHEVIERMHSGADPTWRALAMHRAGDCLYEVAEWLRPPRQAERRFNVLTWEFDSAGLGVRWQRRLLTRPGAMRVFTRLKQESAR